jgi:PBP1b-binding outer membrane lipoprotein LpoB
MKIMVVLVSILLLLSGCSRKPAPAASSTESSASGSKAKVYSMKDVDQELTQGGVQSGASREQVQSFFKDHSAYHVCQDSEGGLIAVMRNKQADPKADDQYIVVGYKDGAVNSIDIGPPQFSAGNVASYCQ